MRNKLLFSSYEQNILTSYYFKPLKMRRLFFLLSLLPLFVACDNDDDTTIQKNSHRIKQLNSNFNNTFFAKVVFTYDGENLVNSTQYNLNEKEEWSENIIREYTYSGNNVTLIFSTNNDGIREFFSKYEYLIQNGLVIEEVVYDYTNGSWKEKEKWVYQYSDNNISAWQGYSYSSDKDAFVLDGKGEYTYNNGILIENSEYTIDSENNWVPTIKHSFNYNESSLSSIISYIRNETGDGWDNMLKREPVYSGEYVSRYNVYSWFENSWMTLTSYSYTYNNEGYLSSLTDGENSFTYEYEEGNGNALLFFSNPQILVYGEPTLKSSGSGIKKNYIPYYQRIRNW